MLVSLLLFRLPYSSGLSRLPSIQIFPQARFLTCFRTTRSLVIPHLLKAAPKESQKWANISRQGFQRRRVWSAHSGLVCSPTISRTLRDLLVGSPFLALQSPRRRSATTHLCPGDCMANSPRPGLRPADGPRTEQLSHSPQLETRKELITARLRLRFHVKPGSRELRRVGTRPLGIWG